MLANVQKDLDNYSLDVLFPHHLNPVGGLLLNLSWASPEGESQKDMFTLLDTSGHRMIVKEQFVDGMMRLTLPSMNSMSLQILQGGVSLESVSELLALCVYVYAMFVVCAHAFFQNGSFS